MKSNLLCLDGTTEHDPSIDAWFQGCPPELSAIAQRWFSTMRSCGDEVRELIHDGCPVACFGDAPFAYVNVFTAHVNVGFFHGAALSDPTKLLQGSGRFMRHIKLTQNASGDEAAIAALIADAWADIKQRVEHG